MPNPTCWRPLNARPVITALGGTVTAVFVAPGDPVAPGQPLLHLVRAAIPRPEFAITGGLLPTLSEDVHTAVAAFRNASTHVEVIRRELARVREFTETGTTGGLPILPRKTEIDLEYDLARAEQDLANSRREIERHGLELATLEGPESITPGVATELLWRRALAAGGFWTTTEDAVLEALPEATRRVPWVIGALGELAATGRSGDALIAAVRDVPEFRDSFPDAVALLLGGDTVAHVLMLAQAGELAPSVVVRAPVGAPDWDAFHAEPVHVEHEDESVVVIAPDGVLAEGDDVVVEGAFALSLALRGGSGAADPHAGHDH